MNKFALNSWQHNGLNKQPKEMMKIAGPKTLNGPHSFAKRNNSVHLWVWRGESFNWTYDHDFMVVSLNLCTFYQPRKSSVVRVAYCHMPTNAFGVWDSLTLLNYMYTMLISSKMKMGCGFVYGRTKKTDEYVSIPPVFMNAVGVIKPHHFNE